MSAAIVNIITYSDEDFSHAFKYKIGDVVQTFSGDTLRMQVRKTAADQEVYIDLSSADPVPGDDFSGVDIYALDGDTVFSINMARERFEKMAVGDYEYSLIAQHQDGSRSGIMRGTLSYKMGATRWQT